MTNQIYVCIENEERYTIEDLKAHCEEIGYEFGFDSFMRDALSKNGSLRTIEDYYKFYC